MIEELAMIEYDASRHSRIHHLDGRVKLIAVFLFIILIVSYPISSGIFYVAPPLFILFSIVWAMTGLSGLTYLKRLMLTLPFGMFIIIFQVFFKNPYYTTWTPIALPFPFPAIYLESVEFAGILLLKFLLCISSIILLSSTTPMQEILRAGRRLGLPPVMALSLGMMIRYLFLFAEMYARIQQALKGRNFDPWNKKLPYQYRLRTLGYAMGVLFLRSYEQGERTYTAMLCRGYGAHSFEQVQKKPLTRADLVFLSSCGVTLPLIVAGTFILFG